MFFISVVLFAIFIILYYSTKKTCKSFSNLCLRLVKESIVTLGLFNALNVGFSAGIHLKYSDNASLSSVFHFFSTVSLIFAVGGIIAIIICLKIAN
jgi:hypothetical protein